MCKKFKSFLDMTGVTTGRNKHVLRIVSNIAFVEVNQVDHLEEFWS